MSAFEYFWEKSQYHLREDMINWCLKNIGPGNSESSRFGPPQVPDLWYCWWALGMGGFVFATQEALDKFTDQWKPNTRHADKRSTRTSRSSR